MLRVIDGLAGAIYHSLDFFLKPFSYILAGGILVAIPLYAVVWVMELFGL